MMKRLLLLLSLLTAFWATAGAQTRFHRRIPVLDYAHLERNALQFPGGTSENYETFLRKLDTLVITGRGDNS